MKFFIALLLSVSWALAAEDCVDCLNPEQPLTGILNNGLSASLQSLEDIAGCSLPAVGSSVRHNLAGNTTNRIPNNSQFVLRRPANKSWVVEFNATFSAGPNVTAEQAQQIEERTRQCFAQSSTAMVGPDGHRLRMELRNASSPNPVGPEIPITVMPTGRGNANTFSLEFTCATIVHEFLHHAGLCDEYPETEPSSVQNASSCRVVVQQGSIMSVEMGKVYDERVGLAKRCLVPESSRWRTAPHEHLDIEMSPSGVDVFSQMTDRRAADNGWCTMRTFNPTSARPAVTSYMARGFDIPRGFEIDFPGRNVNAGDTRPVQTRLACRCPAGNQECVESIQAVRDHVTQAYLPERRRYHCPYGTTEASSTAVDQDFGVNDQRAQGYIEFRSRPRSNLSLLHPAHFLRVLRGSCRAIDQQMLYDRCAQFAYRHSMPENAPADCSTVPAECRDPLKYLGGPPVER